MSFLKSVTYVAYLDEIWFTYRAKWLGNKNEKDNKECRESKNVWFVTWKRGKWEEKDLFGRIKEMKIINKCMDLIGKILKKCEKWKFERFSYKIARIVQKIKII